MTSNRRIDCLIYVLIAGVGSYLAQVSHVPNEQLVEWKLHDWVGAVLFVLLAILNAWKAFRSDPLAGVRPAQTPGGQQAATVEASEVRL